MNETIDNVCKEIDIMRKTHKETMLEKFEAEYPNLAVNFKALQQEQYEMFASKNMSYGMGNISLGTNLETKEEKKMSLSGIFFRVNDKINRWKNLLMKEENNYHEPLTDTYKDISVYCIIAQLIDKDKWKK